MKNIYLLYIINDFIVLDLQQAEVINLPSSYVYKTLIEICYNI